MLRSMEARFGLLIVAIVIVGLVVTLAPRETGADGVCGELHGEAPAHDGHRDGDGDGLICEGHPDPQPGEYNRAEWQFDSAAARELLGCDDSEHADHVVALKEAHDSGGANWTRERKQTFANDISNLRCLDAGFNIAKSDSDLAEWSGGSCELRQEIAITTTVVKQAYGLEIDSAEAQAITEAIEADCAMLALESVGLEVRINARRLANGRVEFALQHRLDGGEWSDRILPRARQFPTNAAIDRWLSSTPLSLP